jgi:hypothetical protein
MPDGLQQFVLFDEMSSPLDQKDQKVERPGRHRDRLAVTEEQTLWGVELERPELVRKLDRSSHYHQKKKFLRLLLAIPQDFRAAEPLGSSAQPGDRPKGLWGWDYSSLGASVK